MLIIITFPVSTTLVLGCLILWDLDFCFREAEDSFSRPQPHQILPRLGTSRLHGRFEFLKWATNIWKLGYIKLRLLLVLFCSSMTCCVEPRLDWVPDDWRLSAPKWTLNKILFILKFWIFTLGTAFPMDHTSKMIEFTFSLALFSVEIVWQM